MSKYEYRTTQKERGFTLKHITSSVIPVIQQRISGHQICRMRQLQAVLSGTSRLQLRTCRTFSKNFQLSSIPIGTAKSLYPLTLKTHKFSAMLYSTHATRKILRPRLFLTFARILSRSAYSMLWSLSGMYIIIIVTLLSLQQVPERLSLQPLISDDSLSKSKGRPAYFLSLTGVRFWNKPWLPSEMYCVSLTSVSSLSVLTWQCAWIICSAQWI